MNTPQEMAAIIANLAQERGCSVNKLLTESGAGRNLIDRMKQGKEPSITRAKLVADYLGVSTDYLLTSKEMTNQPALKLVQNSEEEIYMNEKKYTHVRTKDFIASIKKEFMNEVNKRDFLNKAYRSSSSNYWSEDSQQFISKVQGFFEDVKKKMGDEGYLKHRENDSIFGEDLKVIHKIVQFLSELTIPEKYVFIWALSDRAHEYMALNSDIFGISRKDIPGMSDDEALMYIAGIAEGHVMAYDSIVSGSIVNSGSNSGVQAVNSQNFSNSASRNEEGDVFDLIKKTSELNEKGILTEEEYNEKKKELLSRI